MKVYRHTDEMANVSRERCWTVSEYNPDHRYYDFRVYPELIAEVLEDFRPYGSNPSIQEFYELLRNINSDKSHFETNDCAFQGPWPNVSKGASTRALQASGRFMFYFRETTLNTNRAYVEWLEEGLHYYLSQLTPELQEAVVGTSIMKMHMSELGSRETPVCGFELCVHFWAWGNDEDEVWSNLHAVMQNVHRSLAALSRDTLEKRYLISAAGA